MIDLHTHILPDMDDGARDVATSLAMLRAQQAQGVTGVALTPHFYRDEERPARFFERRKESWKRLLEALDETEEEVPSLALGAEVAWVPGLCRWDDLSRYCIGYSRYLLLELPDSPWHSRILDELYDLMSSQNVIPVLAHLERYFKSQKPDHLQKLLHMGVPVQISAGPMLRTLERFSLAKKIKGNPHCLLISDCHNLTSRPPNLGPGLAGAKKNLPQEQISGMIANSDRIFAQAIRKEDHDAPK